MYTLSLCDCPFMHHLILLILFLLQLATILIHYIKVSSKIYFFPSRGLLSLSQIQKPGKILQNVLSPPTMEELICLTRLRLARGVVLQNNALPLFRGYGAEGYPFSDQKITHFASQDDEIRKHPSLKLLLVSPQRDYVINNKEEKVFTFLIASYNLIMTTFYIYS